MAERSFGFRTRALHAGGTPEPVDLVDVFRKHDALPGVLAEAAAIGAKALWLQLGSWHEAVARQGQAAGLRVVTDRCLKI
ncbi:hypothetical protein GCM10009569_21760 [Arthrobacter russicus]|uniref:CoA-binding protein n=1 Tax=Arthrobacter russicus TaxID=172040 RepID=A0ABU1J7A0_9MICC|nr:putative CoA-binding protein [Arthrobacter russicus]